MNVPAPDMPAEGPRPNPSLLAPGAITLGLPEAFQSALTQHQAGNLAEAQRLYDVILGVEPRHFDALHMRGVLEAQRGRLDEAHRLLSQALAINPRSAEALSNHANVLNALHRFAEALASCDQALTIKPDSAELLNNRGAALATLTRYEEALASYDQALAIKPDLVDALYNRGTALAATARYDEALGSFDRALAIRPRYPEALYSRGLALRNLERYEDALASFDQVLAVKPVHLDALYNRGIALQFLQRYEEALASYAQALAIRPDFAEVLNNRGVALKDLKRCEEALASYDQALAVKPGYAEAFYNRGLALHQLQRYHEALASYDRALAIRPDYADALNYRGLALQHLKRHEEASRDLERAVRLKPDLAFARGTLLHSRMHCCDWQDHEEESRRVVADLHAGKRVADPFTFLSISDSAEDQLQCARTWVAHQCPPSRTPLWQGERYRHDRIRLAYLSADFREHPVAYLMAGLFERHDRNRFETTAVSFGPDAPSPMRSRLQRAFGQFIDVRRKSDGEVANLLRELEIDIAVDLTGLTLDSRTGIFAQRPAPIQVNYLGYPGTIGAPYIDYIVADRAVIPRAHQRSYTEKVVYLPDSFQANDSTRHIAAAMPSRADVGLPSHGFVFCSFNHSYKITPTVFAAWMRLLRQIQGSVLWVLGGNAAIEANLRREAETRGVDPARLVFALGLPYPEHMARYRLADLFLDTLPFNAGTTASDALWAGLPLVTCSGEALAARMAGSLLRAIGLPELITQSLPEYEALALQLATNPPRLAGLRDRLARHRDRYPLFDTDRFRRHLEAAYVEMWERAQRGEPPASFAIAPVPEAG